MPRLAKVVNVLLYDKLNKELKLLGPYKFYVPRLAKVVNVLAIRQVKQGTETTRFRIGYMCIAWLKQ